MTNYLNKSIIEINKLLKEGTIKPLDLVNEAFDKIEKENLGAFITLNKDEAIRKAEELGKKEVDNILFGIPIAIKDNILTKNLRTTAASHMLDDFIPIYDATVVKKIKEKNMIIIGKTNMDEFAMGSTGETSYYGETKNPWNKSKVPGGSSSGSAAAISKRLAMLSLGTDTGGSIRQPSSFCGTVGLKPTYGRVSRYGVIAFASSLDQVGPITKNVYENALLLNVIAGKDEMDYTTSDKEINDYTSEIGKDINGIKIALPNYYMGDLINTEVKDKIENVIKLLEQNGAIVEKIDIPYLEYAIPLYQTIALAEASSNLSRYDGIRYGYLSKDFNDIDSLYKKNRTEAFGNEVKRRIMIGSYVLSGKNAHIYYEKALKVRNAMKKSFERVFENYNFIIGPTNTSYAYDLNTKKDDVLKSFYDDLLTIPVNMAGPPAMSLPVGFSNSKMPIGMQIIAPWYGEKDIYRLSSFIEERLNLNLNPGGEE